LNLAGILSLVLKYTRNLRFVIEAMKGLFCMYELLYFTVLGIM